MRESSDGGFDADGAELLGAQAGVGAVGFVFDPGEGIDGPDASYADLGLGVVEVGQPGLEVSSLCDEELFVVRGAVGDVG